VLGGFYIRDENGERRSGGRQRGILIFGTCAGFLVSNSVIEVGELCLSAHIAQPNSNRWWNWGLDLGLGWNGGIYFHIILGGKVKNNFRARKWSAWKLVCKGEEGISGERKECSNGLLSSKILQNFFCSKSTQP